MARTRAQGEDRLTRDGILGLLREHQEDLQRYAVRRIGLFGSYATGAAAPASDVDFVVEFEQPTVDNYLGLVSYLESLLGRPVDVLTPAGVESIRVPRVADQIRRTLVYV
jgi:hypothetical protein